ncbi:Type II secretory pathway, pullulanase PulA [Roseovarius faecimaris]|uniref:Type II secretory pathway, pullulanase PulA n=1 Tax=Roseovarius faecimaris TaxID=2494550 RepID=A0A6I6ILR2_9RHOB|nr:sulfotransferase family 2 domain-containing protein [Roseovarius faecimaris]QGX97899.1 Type II secretory pathway, pullulanase PulA [Roseovarius faecimaris]
MIISPGRNYIFVHIPKTGGTSLSLALEGRARKDDILIGDTPKARRRKGRLKGAQAAGRLWKHATLADIEGLVSAEFIAGAFTVTLVRNPWDRMVSLYHWLQDQSFAHPMVARAQELGFRPFLDHPDTRRAIAASPYASYMRDAGGHERASLYIRLERFEADAAPLWRHLGFELALPHENASRRARAYQDYYDSDSRDWVAELCAEDIARFKYRFSG